jgi:hypothetical protein
VKEAKMSWSTVDGYNDVIETVRAFNKGLEEGEDLGTLLSYFRAWYYIPELDAVGPSKFIGYRDMTAGEYMRSEGLDGRVTEPVLRRWFDVLEDDTPELAYVRGKVEQLLRQHKKSLNRAVRLNAPRGWKLHEKESPITRGTEAVSGAGNSRPIVEVFWRAFLSLYPEDQDALAKRILEYSRRC